MKTEYEKCLAGEPFIGSKDPKIMEMILRTRRLLAQFNAADYADTERKQALLREMFGRMGKGVHVDIDFHCEYGKHIFIGDKVIINMNCTFVDNNRIDIGSNVLIAPNVQIYTATHSTKVNERMVQDWSEGEEICRTYALPVRVEDGVWIGGGSVLLPGVTIGRNSVIGAGSVVTRSIPENCVADIGSNVLIAPNVQIYTATHSTKVNERMVQDWSEGEEICRTYALPVRVEDGVWIGGGSVLLPGVTIGRNSVIGAGSVVTRSIPENCVAVGNPCRVIKHLQEMV